MTADASGAATRQAAVTGAIGSGRELSSSSGDIWLLMVINLGASGLRSVVVTALHDLKSALRK